MRLRAKVRDCLYLNWALPVEALPPAPDPLRYELHSSEGRDHVFASALLFHHDSLHLAAFPFARAAFPQLNLRLYVLDEQGVPSVLFRRMLMPSWMATAARLASHQPIEGARLAFPRPSDDPDLSAWRWRAELGRERGNVFEVEARRDASGAGATSVLGPWERMVQHLTDRTRGYARDVVGGALRRVDVSHPAVAVWPVRAEIVSAGFLPRCFGGPEDLPWPPLHSAWLAPEIPFAYDLRLLPRIALAPTVPQPAAGRTA